MNKLINPCFDKWLHRILFWPGYMAIVCDVGIVTILESDYRIVVPPPPVTVINVDYRQERGCLQPATRLSD